MIHCSAQYHSIQECKERVALANEFPDRCSILAVSGSRPRKTRNVLHLLHMCMQEGLARVYAAYVPTRPGELAYRQHKKSIYPQLLPVMQIATSPDLIEEHCS